MPNQIEIPIVKLLIFIVDWSKVQTVVDILQGEHGRLLFFCKGRGTASSAILDLLGIGSTEKAMIFCLAPDSRIACFIKAVSRKLGLHSPGTGIAFTLPLSGVNNPIIQLLSEETQEKLKTKIEGDIDKMKESAKHDLIVALVNQGYSDELMAVAREAGAGGGTVITARAAALEGAVKFFGISMQEEKEIIAILSKRETKNGIMQAISQNYGMASEARGVVFSLPADDISGLDLT